MVALLLTACGAPDPRHPSSDLASVHVQLSEGGMESEVLRPSVRTIALTRPLVLHGAWRGDLPLAYRTGAELDDTRYELDDAATRLSFGSNELAEDASAPYMHVSEERVELALHWYPDLPGESVLEVVTTLPPAMRLFCSGEPLSAGRSWRLPAHAHAALVGIAQPGASNAGRVTLAFDEGWMDDELARELTHFAARAVELYRVELGDTRRERFTVVLPPRQGVAYWTEGLIVVPQYFAGYAEPQSEGRDDVSDDLRLEMQTRDLALDPDPAALEHRSAPAEAGGDAAQLRMALAHEIAHEHWHGYPTVGGWLHVDEALATYSAWRALPESERDELMVHAARALMVSQLRPDAPWTDTERHDLDAYYIGPLFFGALANTFGRARLHEMLRQLVVEHRREPMTEERFLAALERGLGVQARELFREWSRTVAYERER